MIVRCSVLMLLVAMMAAVGHAASPEVDAAAQPLLQDIRDGRAIAPEAIAALRAALPGNDIWAAFAPVDLLVRQAYRLQRQQYIAKDPAMRQRREALELLPALAEAIRSERSAYNRGVIRTAVLQVPQVENALKHMHYHAALCVLWSMADLLGLWDRQAALIVAEDHAEDLQAQAARGDLPERKAARIAREYEVIAGMIETAIAWEPLPESIGPDDIGPVASEWRETRCLHPCAERYRDWQRELSDFRYGWVMDDDTAADPWRLDCDWRNLQPPAVWPGAAGAPNAGGL